MIGRKYCYFSRKQKGFNFLKLKPFHLIGGGEIRTLVLSKLHNDAYMLSSLNYSATPAVRNPTRELHTSYNLETLPLEVKLQTLTPRFLTTDLKSLVQS